VRAALDVGDALLLGTDLRKDASRLVPAYDDAQGVTAAFNKNALQRMHMHVSGIEYGPKGEKRHIPLNTADLRYKELMAAVEGRSVMLEEYARQMIYAEEVHAGEVDKMMRKPGELAATRKPG